MSASVIRLPVAPRPDPNRTLAAAQRAWLADLDYEKPWSDSALIAAYFHCEETEGAADILAELSARARGGRHG